MSIILYFKGKQLFLLQNQRFSTRLLFLSVFFIYFFYICGYVQRRSLLWYHSSAFYFC